MNVARCSSSSVVRAQTRSGHIEPASVKRQHLKACKGQAKDDKQTGEKRFEVHPFLLYTLRHTCLTRWLANSTGGHRRSCLIRRGFGGAPGVTRTPGLLVRSQTLYPTELQARAG